MRKERTNMPMDEPTDGRVQAADEPRVEALPFDVGDFPGGLAACLEAVLMVADQPQQTGELARVFGMECDEVERVLEALREGYERQSRGFELRRTARGWQYANRAEFEPVVAAFVTDGQTSRLSQAALEALAVVAYRQPVTRAQIAAIRGVNSDGVVRSLLVRGLVKEEGVDADSHAALLVTSPLFLEKMGLDGLEQLPGLAPFMPDMGEMVHQAQGHGDLV